MTVTILRETDTGNGSLNLSGRTANDVTRRKGRNPKKNVKNVVPC